MKSAAAPSRSRPADISLYRTSISHLVVDFSFFPRSLRAFSPFALQLLAVIGYRSVVYARTTRITIPRLDGSTKTVYTCQADRTCRAISCTEARVSIITSITHIIILERFAIFDLFALHRYAALFIRGSSVRDSRK